MDPHILSTTFATIVGLLCNFKSERKSASDDEYKEFIEWLSKKRHDKVREGIESNMQLSVSLKVLLKSNHDDLVNRLSNIDKSLMLLTSKSVGFESVSNAIDPTFELSEQSISLLKQFDASGAGQFLLFDRVILPFDVKGIEIQIDDPRFLEDDLEQLVKLKLLSLTRNKEGKKIYSIKRNAIRFLAEIEL
ncbi:hypothetical protein ACRTEQ_23520 [Vibrio alginolyticus]|uniref:hypothetical protein n=1 Tax=Vibrio alginolyticus TaxID=663 RepID=UPI003D7EF29E